MSETKTTYQAAARLPDENALREALTGLYYVWKGIETKQRVLEDMFQMQERQILALQAEMDALKRLLAHLSGQETS